MKKFIFFCVVAISALFSSCVTIEDDGITDVFEKVITFEGMSADELYDKAENWVNKEFRIMANDSLGSAINFKSKEQHTLQATYRDTTHYVWSTGLCQYAIDAERYAISIDTKDGRLRFTSQLTQVSLGGGENWISAGHKHQKKANSEDIFEKLVSSLTAEVKGTNKNSDW